MGLNHVLCNIVMGLKSCTTLKLWGEGGGLFKPNQVLPNQNLTICLFQVQSRFGLVLSRVGRVVVIETKANLAQFQ